MLHLTNLLEILDNSPSVAILRSQNRRFIFEFLIKTFKNDQNTLTFEQLKYKLADYLEYKGREQTSATYEEKAVGFIDDWVKDRFLNNYDNGNGELFYELSADTEKAIDWLMTLQKKAFIGTESRFLDIFNQLKELVEFTNEDREKRLEILKIRQRALQKEIDDLEKGENVKVFQEFEIIPRFQNLTRSAKELLSDFKEVEKNFSTITKEIYQKHIDTNQSKSDILTFTFDALDQLKDSNQGKSFYAFWDFLMNQSLQEQWGKLVDALYETLEEKGIEENDPFLRKIKKYLHLAGAKVHDANDKLAEKLSRVIKDRTYSQRKAIDQSLRRITSLLSQIHSTDEMPVFSINVDGKPSIDLPFERKLTRDLGSETDFDVDVVLADNDLPQLTDISQIFSQQYVDKGKLRENIEVLLAKTSQVTLREVITQYGLNQGLPEVLGYLDIVKEFTPVYDEKRPQKILFDPENNKYIQLPDIIITQ